MRTAAWWAGLVFCTLTSPAPAQESAAAAGPLERIEAAVRAAWERSPDLEATRASVEVTRAEAEAAAVAGGSYLQLQAEGIGSSFDEEPNAARYLRVGKPFSWPGQARAGRAVVEQTASWSEAARREMRLQLAGEVARSWVALAEQRAVVGALERVVDRFADAVELQREKNELGEVSGSDLLQLELEQIDARSRLAEARAELTARRGGFVRLAGEQAPLPREGALQRLVDGLRELPASPCSTLARRAAAVRRAEQRAELTRRQARLVSRTKWGRPAAEVEWEAIPDIDGAEGFDALGVMLEIPLPFGRSGRLAEARARADSRRADAEAARITRDVEARCAKALAEARAGREQLGVIGDMEARLEDAEVSLAGQFRLGVASYLQYIDGINRLEDVRVSAVRARGRYLAGRIRLAALIGSAELFPLPGGDPTEESP